MTDQGEYIEIFFTFKNDKTFNWKNIDSFDIFAQNIDCGYTLEPLCLGGSTEYLRHSPCFRAKIRKIGMPLHTPVLLHKSKVEGGIYYMEMLSC